jgi:AcrR family transcriptional regulator
MAMPLDWLPETDAMRPRDVLAANLRALMAARPDLGTLAKITAACGVSNGTLDRIRRAAVSTGIDELQPLGRAFGLQPWEWLQPRGPAALSPLAQRLAEQLDRAVHDPQAHAAAFAAASAVIDALTTRPGSPPAPEPAGAASARPRRATEKPGG